MGKSRFTETQIVAILKEADAGMKVGELCRKHGISDATYYQWKSKYGGMEASDLKRVRELEAENAKLKRMYAELALENTGMKDLIAKKLQGRTRSGIRRVFWCRSTVCRSREPAGVWACLVRPGIGNQCTGRYVMPR
jgi:putative transposase